MGCVVEVGSAQAQPPPSADAGTAAAPAPPPAPAPSAPDVVMLRSGGLVRGTISELDPAGKVVIVTLTGEARTFSMSEVSYAGPASEAPKSRPSPAGGATGEEDSDAGGLSGSKDFGGPIVESKPELRPEVTIHAREARLSITSAPAGLTLHKRSSSAIAVGPGGVAVATGFEEICTAPCEATMPAGSHTFGVSEPGKPAVQANAVNLPPGKSAVSATYTSRSGTRAGGWVLMSAGAVVGGLVMLAAFGKEQQCSEYSGECYETSKVSMGTLVAGTGIMIGGMLGGLVMIGTSDNAQVHVSGRRSPRALPGVRVTTIF
jgi:hypothetical protein